MRVGTLCETVYLIVVIIVPIRYGLLWGFCESRDETFKSMRSDGGSRIRGGNFLTVLWDLNIFIAFGGSRKKDRIMLYSIKDRNILGKW